MKINKGGIHPPKKKSANDTGGVLDDTQYRRYKLVLASAGGPHNYLHTHMERQRGMSCIHKPGMALAGCGWWIWHSLAHLPRH